MKAEAPALASLLKLPGLRPSGKNQYLAQCPAHDDSNASLSIGVDAKGVIGLTCHVGCKSQAICKALGLSMKDLFPADNPAQRTKSRKAKPVKVALVAPLSAEELKLAEQAAKKLGPSNFAGFALSAVYVYRLENGKVWTYRARFDNKAGDKQIFPFHHNGDGWVKSEPSAPRKGKPLYRLPEILATNEPVFIVEGEKCADALASLGLASTTSGAAKSAGKAHWGPLAGRRCVIWADNDDPGDQYANDVAARLGELGCDVALIDVAALGLSNTGDDAADWLAANPQASAADVLVLPTVAPEIMAGGVELICAADIKPKAIKWLWKGYLARGMLHLLAGDGGTGKTTTALTIAAAITTGAKFPDGTTAPVGNVMIWSGEDDAARVLIPRLEEAGADLMRVRFVGNYDGDEGRRAFDPSIDIPSLEAQAKQIPGGISLIIVDPIVNAVAGDSHNNADVRRGLQPLHDLGANLEAAILGVTHFAKNTEGKNTADRIIGSVGYKNFARLAMVCVKGDGGECRMVRCKSNIGPDGDGFSYTIDIVQRSYDDELNDVSRVVWGVPLFGYAKTLLGQVEGKRGARDEAADWLYSTLSVGPLSSKSLKAKAAEDGIAWHTVERAKNQLGVVVGRVQEKGKGRGQGEWVWNLAKPFR